MSDTFWMIWVVIGIIISVAAPFLVSIGEKTKTKAEMDQKKEIASVRRNP